MKKKGFTLIELLAVIVILAIIALIATPIILKVIEDAKKSAAVDSAYGYIEAIEFNNAMVGVNAKYKDKGITDSDDLSAINSKINVKGNKATEIYSKTIISGKVVSMKLCIGGYEVEYKNGKATAGSKCGNGSVEEEQIDSQDVQYTPPTDSGSSATTVQEALDELYKG